MSSPPIERWIRPEIRALSAYHVPPAEGLVKLDAMENPYGWPEEVVAAWLELLRGVPLNRYPDPGAARVRSRLREAMGVPEGMDLLLGNGSDEIIQILAMAAGGPGRVLLAPEPGFAMYRLIAAFTGMQYVGVPLAEDFSLDLPAMLDAIATHQPALTFLAYPNNPTGNLFDERAVEAIIQAADGLVVVDEAYHAFAEQSFMDRLGCHDNLLVMRTLSKLGLAGLRLGLLVGAPGLLGELEKVRLPYNINVLTQASADFALARRDLFATQTRRIREERERMYGRLGELPVTAYPSVANFILFRVPPGRGETVFAGIKRRGVLVKSFGGNAGPLADCLRVTVGTPQENDRFLDALAAELGARG